MVSLHKEEVIKTTLLYNIAFEKVDSLHCILISVVQNAPITIMIVV